MVELAEITAQFGLLGMVSLDPDPRQPVEDAELFLAQPLVHEEPRRRRCDAARPADPLGRLDRAPVRRGEDEVRALVDSGGVAAGASAGALTKARGALEAEIGDLLFDTFLACGLAERDGLGVSLAGAATRACTKLHRRCPYVFGNEVARLSEDAERIWQRVKKEEKAEAAKAAVASTAEGARGGAVSGDVLIFVSKFPTRGKSKTRLIPALGEEGALDMARALVADAVVNFGQAPELAEARRVLLFAPADAEADFREYIRSLDPELVDAWTLVPMANSADLINPDLGGKLAAGLDAARKLPSNASNGPGGSKAMPCGGAVCFMGTRTHTQTHAHTHIRSLTHSLTRTLTQTGVLHGHGFARDRSRTRRRRPLACPARRVGVHLPRDGRRIHAAGAAAGRAEKGLPGGRVVHRAHLPQPGQRHRQMRHPCARGARI